ncbi:MAG: DUF1552 domain-containing protein [Vicinamibacterales bacterium]
MTTLPRRALPRRTWLRGGAVCVGLPLLDAMGVGTRASAAAATPSRFVTLYAPNGMVMPAWTPADTGAIGALQPTLAPLAPFRDRLRVESGLSTLGLPAVPAYHAGAATKFLTAASPSPTRGSALRAGMSVDQVAARGIGGDTRLRSLEICLEDAPLTGACDVQYSCAYQNTVSWASGDTPLPMESRPRVVFERLFGDADASPADRAKAAREDRSLLDSLLEGLGRLRTQVSAADRARLDRYAQAIRETEARIQASERRAAVEMPDPGAVLEPAGGFAERYTLMLDLLALALHADLTRVGTVMLGVEASTRVYPEAGASEGHHQLSHHQFEPARLERLAAVNRLHVGVLAYLLARLRDLEDGDATLLDRTLVLYGAGMSDSDRHRHDNLPVLVAGPRARTGGVHRRHANGTPLANLHLSLLDALGVRVEAFGNSTGRLS